MKKIKQERGITLIALVITIIVLLILAGVAISMLSGENGILNRASEAKENTDKSTEIENSILESTELQMYFTIEGKSRYASYGCITNIELGETVNDLLLDLPENYTIYDKDNNLLNKEEKLNTGMIVKNEKGNKVAEIVIYGSLNGDDAFTSGDASVINMAMKGEIEISGCYKVAADVNRDGEINKKDETWIIYKTVDMDKFTQKMPANNYENIVCYTDEQFKDKCINIIKDKLVENGYTVNYNEQSGKYTLLVEENSVTVGEILDIIGKEELAICKSENIDDVYENSKYVEGNSKFYFFTNDAKEPERENDIDLEFEIELKN